MKRKYLNKAAEDMPDLQNIDAGFLTGVNQSKALKPIEFIQARKDNHKLTEH